MGYYQSSLFKLSFAFWITAASGIAYGMESTEWGPEFQLGAPQPIGLGVEFSCTGTEIFCTNKLKYYSDLGYFVLPFGGGQRSIRIYGMEAGTRYYPFSFPLFFGGGLGFRYVGVTADTSAFSIEGDTVATSATMNFNTFYFSPSVGWSFRLSDSLTLSSELGVQFPLVWGGDLYLVDENTGADSYNSETLRTNSVTAMSRIAKFILPKLTLIRLTWRF